ncbi:MAG: metallophosphoesterase [Chitinophagaceae bacterium]|nr:MAG: metallophosphoesterase [Chitinophagaceae bacterium]
MIKRLLPIVCCFFVTTTFAQHKNFKFAFLSDTHIGSPNGSAEGDLRRTIQDINAMPDIDFVVITGDITELGSYRELAMAKQILDSFKIIYYIIPGNHDTGWSESGGQQFSSSFGNDKFSFEHKGIRFIGCASGPYVRMSDGHIPRSHLNWLDKELKKLKKDQPLIFLNHYPMDDGMDNWYEITDRLKQHNTWAVLCGHGHSNKSMNFEDITGVMGRSNLRAKDSIGGFNIVQVEKDSVRFFIKKPGIEISKQWNAFSTAKRKYDLTKQFKRPDYSANNQYSNIVKPIWTYSATANIINSPCEAGGLVITGNQDGNIIALDAATGKNKWQYKTNGAIFSSPASDGKLAVVGSADGNVYCVNIFNGKLAWKYNLNGAVMGSPLIHADTVFIGGSGGSYAALQSSTGKKIWSFDSLQGPVMSRPLLYNGNLIFGAWDRHLYSVSSSTGQLLWKWNNGSSVRHFSPAACIPVAADGIIYIVAPDRFISAINSLTGQTLWRSKDGGLRESIGISTDGKTIFGKSMQDTVVLYNASAQPQTAALKIHAGFGYEHAPSMLKEENGMLYFGTKNGVVYCIDLFTQQKKWTYKIDNSMVNSITLLAGNRLLAATMDGKVVMLQR